MSTHATNPPQRLREETSEAENIQTKTATSITLPSVADTIRDINGKFGLTIESPAPDDNLKPPLELDISDLESQSSSSQCQRHSSDNYTRKVLNRLLSDLFFVPLVFLYLTRRFTVTKGIVLQMA